VNGVFFLIAIFIIGVKLLITTERSATTTRLNPMIISGIIVGVLVLFIIAVPIIVVRFNKTSSRLNNRIPKSHRIGEMVAVVQKSGTTTYLYNAEIRQGFMTKDGRFMYEVVLFGSKKGSQKKTIDIDHHRVRSWGHVKRGDKIELYNINISGTVGMWESYTIIDILTFPFSRMSVFTVKADGGQPFTVDSKDSFRMKLTSSHDTLLW
jgi:hypothetical protein